jgi:hypothetical protein
MCVSSRCVYIIRINKDITLQYTTLYYLPIIVALQLSMQSFGLLSQFLPYSSILDKGLPIWHFQLLYIFSNIILLLAFLKWVSRSILPWPFLFLTSFRCDQAIPVFVLFKVYYVLMFYYFIQSWLVFIRQIPFSLVGPNIFLKTFLSNTINLLIMVLF